MQPAFIDAVQAGQDRQRQINEGQAYANDVVPRARGMASRLIQEAEGYRTKTIENALRAMRRAFARCWPNM